MHLIKSTIKSFYPWLVWLLTASFFYYKYLIQVSPSVMSSQLMTTFSLTGAGLGHLAAYFFYAYLLMQIPVGIILDRWSPARVTTLAVLSCAISVWMFAHSTSLNEAAIYRFIIGLSASFAAVSCFKLTSIWFSPKRFALISGLSMTAAMLGAVGGEGPLSNLVVSYDWRYALEQVALLGFILACFIGCLVRDKSDTSIVKTNKKYQRLALKTQLSMIMNNKQTWLLSIYSGLAFAPVSVFGGLWGTSYLETAYGISPPRAAHEIAFIFWGFAIGCPIVGWLSDYLQHRKKIMAIGTILACSSLATIIYLSQSLTTLSMMLFIFGLSGSCFFLCFSMIKESNATIVTATVLGFMNTFDAICEALIEPTIGKFLDLTWSGDYMHGARAFSLHGYHYGLVILPILLVLAFFILLFIQETHCKNLIEVSDNECDDRS